MRGLRSFRLAVPGDLQRLCVAARGCDTSEADQRQGGSSVSAPSATELKSGHGGLGRDFLRLWQSYTVSAVGSALSVGALPLIAIMVLDASPLQVSLLAAIGAISSAIITLPLGNLVERREKRATMVIADLLQFAALASMPLAAAFDALTYVHLCLVAIVQTSSTIVNSSASQAYIKHVVVPERRTSANARLDTVNWTTQSAGPPVGGALIGVAGPLMTLIVDAVSFLASAVLLRRLTPFSADKAKNGRSRRELLAGWTFILRHRGLRLLYFNAMLFGGAIMWSSPIMAVLMLKDIGATPLEYGIALGVPCLGGLLGAMLSPKVVTVLGVQRTLFVFGVARTVWIVPMAFVGTGPSAVLIITSVDFCLLLCAGIFNPIFATYRMNSTPDGLMARVSTAWSVSSRTVQPLFITLGGVIATTSTRRWSLLMAGVLCLSSAVLLPWRGRLSDDAHESVP
ncbi:MFS transporter [Streptosporangium sp. NPDC001681]|uniref:MFS transporter n=1 Tax=Streptosporangium sp. NPDC001681 TaxID=3154395 RepID=UPI00332B720C